jgi:hypothetical protein
MPHPVECLCEVCQKENAMSRRTLADFIRQGFFARDKATCDKIIRDAEEEAERAAEDDDDHKEPDGDEGDIHVHVHRDGKSKDNDETQEEENKRLDRLEDGFSKLSKAITRIGDAVAKLTGDGELPEALKKYQFGKKNGENGDETEDAPPEGAPSPDKESGAQSAEALTAAEPDLMEADPALRTGKSMMGDAAYVEKVREATVKLLQDTAARAAVLAPGLKMPTLDAAVRGTATQDALCAFRRRALAQAMGSDLGRVAVGAGVSLDGLSCEGVRTLFRDASERMREINNARGHVVTASALVPADVRTHRTAMQQRLAGINKANVEFWNRQTGRTVH